MNGKNGLNNVVELIKKIGKKKIKFIILYGSYAEGKQTPLSDIDIAVYYDGSKKERFKFRMLILGKVNDKYDIQTFQDLPLYVKKEIMKGKILYTKDNRYIYDLNYQINKEFENFKYRYYDYIKGGVIA